MTKKIVLVHGLGGTAEHTWGNFPRFLEEDGSLDCNVIPLSYKSPHVIWGFLQRAPTILNIANGLVTELETKCNITKDEIILVGHSLGGIIVKKILLRLKDKKVNHNIKKICFFDVPHDGSGYANVAKYISFRNRHLKSICRDSGELDELNDQWIESGLNDKLEIISIIASNDDVVSSSSSKSIFRSHQVKTINNVDHISIVKPQKITDTAYIVLKEFLVSTPSLKKYKSLVSRDLNDWKSIERNHNYKYCSDNKRDSDLTGLIDALRLEQSIIRLTGASGLGKSRLLIKAIESIESIDDSNILIFNASGYENEVKETVRLMVDENASGLVIVENCSVGLHNSIAKEVNKTKCKINLITLAYSNQDVENSLHIMLSPLEDEAIKQILTPILAGVSESDLERVARFSQGYPLMATLIAEHYRKNGCFLGSIESSSMVDQLIQSDMTASNEEMAILSACSLFDVFGTSGEKAGEEAKYITEKVAGSQLPIFDRVINTFTKRQIIHRAGRYARVVPKPLALTLASKWWEEASIERQQQLIDTLPETLIQSFCTQASYLDSEPNIRRFSDRLFGGQSPFVRAEGLLTEKGSKLFRAFVEVNPKSTSEALYRVLGKCTHCQILEIKGSVRRNLVWALEKLCFHASEFEKSAWSLLLLASAENENWSNNATGVFAQLFRVQLSGTEADPAARFSLLQRAIDVDQLSIDKVVIKALENCISTYGGSRTVGAEYQGTKAPLEEWKPKVWQEIFDYWEKAFDYLLKLLERGEPQRKEVLALIGNSIRGFVANHRMAMLDKVITEVVSFNGRYWPEALGNIKSIFDYDSKALDDNKIDLLNKWLNLLSFVDAELPEKLKIVVVNPPWEHREAENGQYVDIGAENAKLLAHELSSEWINLTPHLEILLSGQQRQSRVFGYHLNCKLEDLQRLVDLSLEILVSVKNPNSIFILGVYQSIFEKSPELWKKNIDRLLLNDRLVSHYPDFIRTGKIQDTHLLSLLNLIKSEKLPQSAASALGYGSVVEHIEPSVIANFVLQLTKFGHSASWSALDVIYMYCYNSEGRFEELRDTLKKLVTAVPLHQVKGNSSISLHHWHHLAEKLLTTRDADFAIELTKQQIDASKHGLNHGDIWSYIKPLLFKLMKDYSSELWPIFGEAILTSTPPERYWLQELLDRETSLAVNMPSVLSVVPIDQVMDWCSKNRDLGPIFVARCVNILEKVADNQQPSSLFIALLEEYGSDERVQSELNANMATRGWSGSLVPYLQQDKLALLPLINHKNVNVRRWVQDHISYIEKQIDIETTRDDEQGLGLY